MTGVKIFWTIVLVVGVLFLLDTVIGGAILASIFGPKILMIAGFPQLVIGSLLTYFGWTYSR
jgi:hypothetical protein